MHSENPTKIQICLAPVTNKAQNMLIMSVNQRLNFGFGRCMKIRYKILFLSTLLVDENIKIVFFIQE